MGAGELRRNMIDVIIHAAHDAGHHRFARMAALRGVTHDFLDPFEVDDWHHANQQIDMLRDVMMISDHTAMQALIKQ